MVLTRRDFLRASSAVAAAWGLDLTVPSAARGAAAGSAVPPVIWLQAQGCSGCSVSLLNTIYYMTVDQLLTGTISLKYHSTVMASAGAMAVAVALQALGTRGYVLVVEGAVPTGAGGNYCYLWPEPTAPGLPAPRWKTALQGVHEFADAASVVLAVGTCSAYGGMPGGSPNPTGVKPLSTILAPKPVINIPGCAVHPDWVIGTVAYLIKNGTAPPLDSFGRPQIFYANTVHERCPYRDDFPEDQCQFPRGCKGPITHCDCPIRKWNSGAANTPGVNWCIGAGNPYGNPCLGCTEPGFPDAMSPFSKVLSGFGGDGGDGGGGGGGERDD